MDRDGAIAAALIKSETGAALVDPGPTSTLQTLRRELLAHGVAVTDLEAVLLTHVHLDHAGATGSLAQENPHRGYQRNRTAKVIAWFQSNVDKPLRVDLAEFAGMGITNSEH